MLVHFGSTIHNTLDKMLHVQAFTIKEHSRLEEFIEYLGHSLPGTQFKHEPTYCRKNGFYKIAISSKLSDFDALESLFEKWNTEDEPVEAENVSLIDKLLVRLRA